MYDTSKEICAQGLYFLFLHLRASTNLGGRYDPKTEKHEKHFAHKWLSTKENMSSWC